MAMGPSVRNLLLHYRLQPELITSSGPHQTLLKGDVLAYVSQNNLRPVKQSSTQPIRKKFVPVHNTPAQPKPGPEGFSTIAKRLLDM